MSDVSLDDILKDDPAEKVSAPEQTEETKDVTGETEVDEVAEETVIEETKEEAEPPAAKEETKEQSQVPLASLLDEREKRQAAEKRVEELEAQKEPEKDFFEDPEGRLKKLESDLEARTTNRFVDLTVDLARKNHDDFDEVMAGWKELVDANPGILQQVMSSENPGEESYKIAKQYQSVQEIGDPKEYREKLKEELKAELLEEMKKPDGKALPESLATERNVGSRKGPEFSGPTPLGEILK